jgi:hypothetical protein
MGAQPCANAGGGAAAATTNKAAAAALRNRDIESSLSPADASVARSTERTDPPFHSSVMTNTVDQFRTTKR